MTKYAAERIWREPDGKLIAESAVKNGQAGGLGTSLAYAAGDPIDPEDEDKVGKLGTSKAPADAVDTKGLNTAAGGSEAALAVSDEPVGSQSTDGVTSPVTTGDRVNPPAKKKVS